MDGENARASMEEGLLDRTETAKVLQNRMSRNAEAVFFIDLRSDDVQIKDKRFPKPKPMSMPTLCNATH
jgi:hypothetical protein